MAHDTKEAAAKLTPKNDAAIIVAIVFVAVAKEITKLCAKLISIVLSKCQ